MADFAKALAYTLRHEGGWSDDPDDPGGATNYGVTLKTAQRYGISTKEQLRAIGQAKVADIYRDGYWRFDGVDDQRVATKMFDMAVNMGPGAANKLFARALDFAGAAASPAALAAAANCREANRLLASLCDESAAHYRAIAAKRPASAKFLKGWLRRAAEAPK
jgi:lysozyme family protein